MSEETKKPWGREEKAAWWKTQERARYYRRTVLNRIDKLPGTIFHVEKYGELTEDPDDRKFRLNRKVLTSGVMTWAPARHELFRIRVGAWNNDKPNIIITGGVHGYEVGGIDAALTFLEKHAPLLTDEFNFLVYPCISPLAFEFNGRWNQHAQDINRHFCCAASQTESGETAEECVAVMNSVGALGVKFALHIDLHETTDSDVERFRQEKKDRDGDSSPIDTTIPQGFYLVMNASDEGDRIGQKIIESVREVTAIAPEEIVLGTENKNGVVYLDCSKYPGLGMNFTDAAHRVTTEVYPDIISPEEALAGQIAAIEGALNHLRQEL